MTFESASFLVAAIAVAASTAFSIMTFRQSREGLAHSKESLALTTYNIMLEVDRVFLQRPDLYEYFYDNRPIPTDATVKVELRVLAEFVLDCFECIWDQMADSINEDRSSWMAYIGDIFDSSPVLKDVYNEYAPKKWYPSLDELHNERSSSSATSGVS